MNKGNSSKAGTVFAIIFLLWFIASIGGLIYCSANDMGILVLALFGQYFLVFGIIAIVSEIKKKNFNFIILLFPLIGICAISYSIVYYMGITDLAKIMETLLPFGILALFFLIGAGIFIYAIKLNTTTNKRCTYSVDAVCIKRKAQYSRKHGKIYCPIYMIEYKGKIYELSDRVYTNIVNVKEGDSRTLMINPDNPHEFIDPVQIRITTIFSMIMGLLFMVTPAIVLYLIIVDL